MSIVAEHKSKCIQSCNVALTIERVVSIQRSIVPIVFRYSINIQLQSRFSFLISCCLAKLLNSLSSWVPYSIGRLSSHLSKKLFIGYVTVKHSQLTTFCQFQLENEQMCRCFRFSQFTFSILYALFAFITCMLSIIAAGVLYKRAYQATGPSWLKELFKFYLTMR